METFAPGLKSSVLAVAEALRVIVYVTSVLGLMLQVQQARVEAEALTRPILRAVVIVALVAMLPQGFAAVERGFLVVADTVQTGYSDHPMRTAAKLRASVSNGVGEFSLRRVGETFYQAILAGTVKLIVLIASVLQVPFLLLQYVLKLLCYLFLPVALGAFMIPALSGWATRYVQQSIAILAWPVGFAVTELVAYHLLTGYTESLAVAYGIAPGAIEPASFGNILGGLVAGLWLLVGTVGTPFLMQALICSGSPVSFGGGAALQQFYTLQQVAWMVKSLKSGGVAATVAAASAGTNSNRAGGGMPPPPPSLARAPLPPAAPNDPTGNARAAGVLALTQLPVARTTI